MKQVERVTGIEPALSAWELFELMGFVLGSLRVSRPRAAWSVPWMPAVRHVNGTEPKIRVDWSERVAQSSQASVRTFLARSVASRGRRSTAGRRTTARPKVGGPKRPTNAESRTLRPLTPNSGPIFWDWRYLGAVVESALRSRCLTSKELGHVIMCAYGAPRAGIFNGRVLRDIPSRGQCLTCCVPASHSFTGTLMLTAESRLGNLLPTDRSE